MKNTIFEILNQCRGNLGGSRNNDFIYTSKISDIPASKNTLSLSIRLGTRRKTSLKCSENAGIFYFIKSITDTLISSVSWASPLKIVYKTNSLIVDVDLAANTGSAYRLVSPVRAERYDERPIAGNKRHLLSLFFGGVRGGFFLRSSPQFHSLLLVVKS